MFTDVAYKIACLSASTKGCKMEINGFLLIFLYEFFVLLLKVSNILVRQWVYILQEVMFVKAETFCEIMYVVCNVVFGWGYVEPT